jgi:hypothetical protein
MSFFFMARAYRPPRLISGSPRGAAIADPFGRMEMYL